MKQRPKNKLMYEVIWMNDKAKLYIIDQPAPYKGTPEEQTKFGQIYFNRVEPLFNVSVMLLSASLPNTGFPSGLGGARAQKEEGKGGGRAP